MITPLDIQNKQFSKGVRGYKEDEVDEFLDLVTVDFEKIILENTSLKAQLDKLSTDINKYKGSEGAVLETLEAAKALMADISASAEKRAEILLKNAELDAELIQREARESVERFTDESAQMKNRFNEFRGKYKNLLESELERFDTLSSELFFSMEDFDIPIKGEEFKTKKSIGETQVLPKFAFNSDSDFDKTRINIKIED